MRTRGGNTGRGGGLRGGGGGEVDGKGGTMGDHRSIPST